VKPPDRGALITAGLYIAVALAILALMLWIDRTA
jgi:hypothetical protein